MDANYIDSAKNITNNIANTGAEVFGQASDTVSNIASSGMNTVSRNVEYVQNLGNQYFNNLSSVFYAMIGLVLVCLLVGWGLYVLIIDNVIEQQRILVSGTETPIICNESSNYSINYALANTNGNRRSYGFWVYISDITKYSGSKLRHIAHIGESHRSVYKSSPYIFLDNQTNKIYVRLAPLTEEGATTITEKTLLNGVDDVKKLLEYTASGEKRLCGFTIDYVPVQRWVHICVSINDSKNGTVYVYIDAELVKVIENSSATRLNVADLKIASESKQLFVGGNINDYANGVTGFSGLISKFTMYNYDMNQNDVYKEYNSGPFSGLLTKIGLGAYGIRNPIYKINNANNN